MVKKSSSGRRDKGLGMLAVGAFILTALVFVYLLYYGRALVGLSSGIR